MSHPSSPPIPSPVPVSEVSWADPVRQALFQHWIAGIAAAQGLLPESLRIASADASFRRYLRVDTVQGDSRIVMDAPPPLEDVRPFVAVARHLVRLGLSAPELRAVDAENGFLLLEDLGDDTFTRILARGGDESALYSLAMDALIALQSHPEAARIDVPRQDAAMLADDGASLFTEWYLPEVTGAPTAPGSRKGGAVSRQRERPFARSQPASGVLRIDGANTK